VSVHPAEDYAEEIGTAEQWRRREPPLVPAAVLGIGAVAAELAAAAHLRLASGAELRAVADPEYLVVLGAQDVLPWVDGARYLGWDGRALTLTTHRVVPAADLWRDAAVAQQDAEPESLVVVLPEQILISAMPARAADPGVLLAMATGAPCPVSADAAACSSSEDSGAASPQAGDMERRPSAGGRRAWSAVAAGDTRVAVDRRATVVDGPA
jgi:hypothetical protein